MISIASGMKFLRPGSTSLKPTASSPNNEDTSAREPIGGLSILFSTLCIVDLFGVFPIVALPKSVISCGIYGIPLVISVIGLQLYTAVLLGKSWLLAQQIAPEIQTKNRFPYAAVAELAFGASARRVVTFFIDATVFGSGVPNFIFASQSLQLFWWKISDGQVAITYCVWLLILGLLLCPVMWLGSPKDMKPLALLSVFIVSTVAALTWFCIVTDNESPRSMGGLMTYIPDPQNFLIAYGIIAFQFDIHPLLMTIQVDMKDSTKINTVVVGAFCFSGLMFTITTLLAANRYGLEVDNNILEGIPPSIALYVVVLLVTLQLCLSSAVGNSALFQHLEDMLSIPREFCFRRCLVRSATVVLAVFLAESVPRFDLVMGLVGATLTGPLMFIFPPLFFLKLCYLKSNMPHEKQTCVVRENGAIKQNGGSLSKPLIDKDNCENGYRTFSNNNDDAIDEEHAVKWYDVLLALIVMCMGIGATAVATYTTWSNSIEYATFSPPCLINASLAARSFLQFDVPPV